MFDNLLLATTKSLELEWWTRHPSLDAVRIHVRQLDKQGTLIGGFDADVLCDDIKPHVKSLGLAALDRAICAYVADEAGMETTPCEKPEPEEVEE